MLRYNIFYQVHKGLRTLLYETAILIQQTDFSNIQEANTALTQTATVLDLFDHHAHTEDSIVFAAIQAQEPALVDELEKEHVKDHELGQRLRGLITAFEKAVAEDNKLEVASALNKAFVEFMVFNLEHMAKEEDIINKALWRHYNDTQLQQLTQKIVATVPPPVMAVFSKWMLRGLSNNEISSWLKEIKNNAPDFVFNAMMDKAGEELTPVRWDKIQQSISEGAMLA
jgi:hypothetical protein